MLNHRGVSNRVESMRSRRISREGEVQLFRSEAESIQTEIGTGEEVLRGRVIHRWRGESYGAELRQKRVRWLTH